jgi:hypothetical protein
VSQYDRTGENARNRITSRKRRGLSPREARLPEVERMLDENRSQRYMASAIHVGERTIRSDVQAIRDSKTRIVVYEGPRQFGELDPKYQAMMEDTEEAFIAFYAFAVGKPIPPHWREWLPLLLGPEDVMINVPPRHAKSTVIAVYCAWRIVKNRNVHIIWASKTEQAAKKWAREIGHRFLARGSRLAKVFGEFRPEIAGEDVWQPLSGRFRVMGADEDTISEYTLQIRGLGQQILGSEADVVILDDPTDRETAESEAESEDELNVVREEFFSRLMPGGKLFCVGQRVAEGDLFERLLFADDEELEKNWVHVVAPAISPEGDPLWPQVWPLEALAKVRARVGRRAWETLYQQHPVPNDTEVFDMNEVRRCRQPTLRLGDGIGMARFRELAMDPEEAEPTDDGIPAFSTVVSIDPAFKKHGSVVVADVEYDLLRRRFNCVVKDVQVLERGAAKRRDAMVHNVLAYRPDYLVYEDVGVTQDLEEEPWFQDLKRLVTVIAHRTTGASKGDPDAGMESMALDFERGSIQLPYGDPAAQHATELIEADAEVYPGGEANHLMALWFIKWNRKHFIPYGSLPTKFRKRSSYSGWSHDSKVITRAPDDTATIVR